MPCLQIESDWMRASKELAAIPQLEPTLRRNMLSNVATTIKSMETDLPGLEVTGLKRNEIIEKQRKARVSLHNITKLQAYMYACQAVGVA